jgi:nucleoside-diphosphate-sugar epimerase
VSYEGARILVTGGTGFVGGRLTERLVIEHRANVRVLVRDWSRAVWVSRVAAELVQGEVTERESVDRAVEGCRVVFHCASGGHSAAEYMRTNLEGTCTVLAAAHAAGVKRFVYLSSIAVHGPSPPADADETDAYRSFGRGYSDSKIAAEKAVFDLGRQLGLAVVVVRPTFVWGPRSALFTVRPLLALRSGAFRLVDEGIGDCHAVYIDNLVDLLLAAGTAAEAVGEAFFATDGYGITWREFFGFYGRWLGVALPPSVSSRSRFVRIQSGFLDWVGALLQRLQGSPAPIWKRVIRRGARIASSRFESRGIPTTWDLEKYARRGRLNTDKAKRLLGHQSRWSLAEAMHETELWVRDQLGPALGLGEGLPQENAVQGMTPPSTKPTPTFRSREMHR